MSATPTTRHTCNDGRGPVFGRRTPGCPRCAELAAGAPTRRWHDGRRYQAQRLAEIARHDCRAAGCGPVCTYGDW